MAKTFGPRKQRTREHVLADLSVHHVEGFILNAGHTAQRLSSDYGYDLLLLTFDEDGYVESGVVWLQLKAAETWRPVKSHLVYDIDIRDYNLWIVEEMPVILVLYNASRNRACWLDVQGYFHDEPSRRPKKGAKSVRVRIPERQS
jgi:hypothetical protein